MNRFQIVDTGNYGSTAPCGILDGSHEDRRVTTCRVSSQFTFLFSPFYKYGACSSAQDGGYLNVGTFNKQVDPTKGLNLWYTGMMLLSSTSSAIFLLKHCKLSLTCVFYLVKQLLYGGGFTLCDVY